MFPTLLRRFFGPLLLTLLLLSGRSAQATHFLGGEMNYSYLDANGPTATPFRYRITVTVYINARPGTAGMAVTSQDITIYNRTTQARISTVTLPGTISPTINGPTIPAGCNITPPSQPFIINRFTGIVNLPVSFDGYYAVFSVAARNVGITNINATTNNLPLTLYVSMTSPLIANRSPVFSDTAVAIICQNDTTIALNNAIDPDGDRLVYSFGTPYGVLANNGNTFPPLPNPTPYNPGFSAANPMGTGAGNFALINATTGIARYGSTTANGQFVVAVDVSEYRTINGTEVLLGTTRRDLQLLVGICPPTPPPVLPPSVTVPRSYTIEEGQSLTIPISATQSSPGHPLVLTVNSALLDGSGPFNTTFNNSTGTVQAGNLTGTATATGTGTVGGAFVYNSACGQGRTNPYDIAVTVKDNGCGGKLTSDLFRVTVTRAASPTGITGLATPVCDPTVTRTYTAVGPTLNSYRWRVVGGTIQSGQGTNAVQVRWNSAVTTGLVVLKGVSAYGCLSDSVTTNVDIRPLTALNVTPSAPNICRGASTTLTVSGQTGLTYSWTGGGQTLTGPTITVSPTASTIYTVVGTDGTCTVTTTVTVNVTPPPVADAGPDRSLCPGLVGAPGPTTQLGTPPVTGNTYSWSPATGLSSTTVAQPTLTLPNTTGTSYVATYTLTVTTAGGCINTSSVNVTVNPAAIANAGTAQSVCSGVTTAQLGAPALAGYTYSWSPATGLSSATAAQPTVTLTNTTGAPVATTYTLTATAPTGCVATATVTITTNPAAIANAGPAVAFCPGDSVYIGAPPIAGTTYSWSPATGLSSATSSFPLVTLTNTTGSPIVVNYTLTATTANGCTATATVAVTANPAAIAAPGPAVAFCSGGSAQLGVAPVAGTTYAWTPTTGLSSATVSNPTVTLTNTTGAPITTTYTLQATTATSCQAIGTVAVTVNPAAVATPGPAVAFCSGLSAQLGVAPVAGTTYAWSPATGLSSATVSNPTVTLTNTTGVPITTTYTLTATTANGCIASNTVLVTVNPAAVAVPGSAITICSGLNGQLGGPAVAGYTYSWSPATGLSSATAANPTVTLTNTTGAATTTPYTLTATTANGCVATGTVVVTVNPAAVATPGPAVTICSGLSAQLGVAPITGTTYSWSPATGLSSTTVSNPTVTLTNTTGTPTLNTYTLTATTANGCVVTSTVVVTTNPAAVATTGPAVAFCSGLNAQLGVAPITGTTYAWSPPTGLSSATVSNPTVTLTNTTGAPIATTYTLTATTANGCVATGTVVVTVNPAAVASPGPAVTICSGLSAQLGVAPITGTTYSWSPATGLSSTTVSNPTVTLTNTTGTPTLNTYTLTATTANGCVATNTVVVTTNPAAVANAGPDLPVCSGSYTNLGGNPNAVPGTTYSWSPTTGVTSPNSPTSTVTVTNTTNAPITRVYTLTATTANGCVATDDVTITVSPLAVVDAGPDVTICDLQRVILGTPARPNYTYLWSPSIGLSSATVAQPVLIASNNTSASIARIYTLTVTDNTNVTVQCPSTDAVTITINPRPVAEAISGPASVCPTVTGIAYSVVTPAATAYTWLINGGTIASGQGTPAITVNWGAASTGSFIKVFRLNAQGCSSDTTTLPIIINTRLRTATPTGPGDVTAVAPVPNSVCQAAGPFTYVSGSYANGSTYSWTIIGGTQASTNLNTVTVNWNPVTVPTIGKVVVTETSNPAGGVRCLGTSDTLLVRINPTPLASLAISGPSRVCQGSGPATFALTGGYAGSSFVFQLNGATIAGTGNTRAITLPAPGNYTVTAQETSAQGCPGRVYSSSFTVDPTPTALTITGSAFVCNVATPQQYSVPNTPGSTYAWTVTGGTITSTPTNTNQITVRFNATGPYSIRVVETSSFGCAGPAATRTITLDNPSVTLVSASVDATSDSRIILTLSAPNSGSTPNPVRILRRVAGSGGTFTAVGTAAASATTFTDNSSVDADANAYDYQLDITNGCGTVVTSASATTVRLQATAAAGAGGRDQGRTTLTWNAYAGFTVREYRIYRRTDAGAAELISTVSGTTLTTNVLNGDAGSATGAGFNQNFRVVAVSTDNTPLLSNSNETSVNFANAVSTYNIITPNRDGLNDVLVVDNIQLYPGNTFTVFNRWGREIYRTTNYQNNWGSDDNIPAGVYYYLLQIPNAPSIKSWFEIVK